MYWHIQTQYSYDAINEIVNSALKAGADGGYIASHLTTDAVVTNAWRMAGI